MNKFTITCCGREQAPRILEIFNDAIINTTALYEYKPRTIESVYAWFDEREKSGIPVICALDSDGILAAFGTYGEFRHHCAYKYSVEHSIFVHKDYRRNGLALSIMKMLIAHADKHGVRSMIAAIDSQNIASKQLHEKLDFKFCGCIKQVGYKFSRWLDLDFYQLILSGPQNPEE